MKNSTATLIPAPFIFQATPDSALTQLLNTWPKGVNVGPTSPALQWTPTPSFLESASPGNSFRTEDLMLILPSFPKALYCLKQCYTLQLSGVSPWKNPIPGLARFGVFEVDFRTHELRKRGLKIRLQEQPFQVLATLLDKPRELVTREELRNKLWHADTFVDFDQGLNKAINKIRDALGDSAANPRFIETVARRGYPSAPSAVVQLSSSLATLLSSSLAKVVPDRVPGPGGAARHRRR